MGTPEKTTGDIQSAEKKKQGFYPRKTPGAGNPSFELFRLINVSLDDLNFFAIQSKIQADPNGTFLLLSQWYQTGRIDDEKYRAIINIFKKYIEEQGDGDALDFLDGAVEIHTITDRLREKLNNNQSQ